jgi:hypothetical protein
MQAIDHFYGEASDSIRAHAFGPRSKLMLKPQIADHERQQSILRGTPPRDLP